MVIKEWVMIIRGKNSSFLKLAQSYLALPDSSTALLNSYKTVKIFYPSLPLQEQFPKITTSYGV